MLNFCFRILNLSIKGNQLYSFFSFIDGLMTSVFLIENYQILPKKYIVNIAELIFVIYMP